MLELHALAFDFACAGFLFKAVFFALAFIVAIFKTSVHS